MRALAVVVSVLAMNSLAFASSSKADGVADFYRGKTVTLISADAAGGGYDAYARLVARFIGDHIPGKPNVVVQNMPGAGGLKEINYLYNVAPKDGSTVAIIVHGTIFKPLFDPREVRYKIDGFRWLGSVTPITVIAAFRKDAPVKTVSDLFDHEVIVGGASGGTTVYVPQAVNSILHTKMKIVVGYENTNQALLAVARKEVAGVVGIGLDSLQGEQGGGGVDYNILFQAGAARSRSLPDVPLIQEFASADADREVLEAIFASFSIGRVFATPLIPVDRLAALRAAFEATVEDPAFVEQAHRQHADVGYVSPDEIQEITDHVYGQPQSVLNRAAEIMQSAQ